MELKIGELAKRSGCQVETIRFYEKEGLLPPTIRSQGNYRLYGDGHAERLLFIRHCRSLEMSLHEIRQLLQFKDAPPENCEGVNRVLNQHIEQITRKIAELCTLQNQLIELRHFCTDPSSGENCAILKNLSTSTKSPLTIRLSV